MILDFVPHRHTPTASSNSPKIRTVMRNMNPPEDVELIVGRIIRASSEIGQQNVESHPASNETSRASEVDTVFVIHF